MTNSFRSDLTYLFQTNLGGLVNDKKIDWAEGGILNVENISHKTEYVEWPIKYYAYLHKLSRKRIIFPHNISYHVYIRKKQKKCIMINITFCIRFCVKEIRESAFCGFLCWCLLCTEVVPTFNVIWYFNNIILTN